MKLLKFLTGGIAAIPTTGKSAPAPGWTKMQPLDSMPAQKDKIQLQKPTISNTILPDALSINKTATSITKPINYNEFLLNIMLNNTKKNWKKLANIKYALRSQVSKHQPGGRVLPTAPPPSDNTRVSKIPNKGEGIYEATPQGIGDFLPFIGTYRAAKRIDNGEPNASYKDLIVNGAMDLLGARMIGSVIKAAGKANRIHKALKSRGFTQITKEPTHWVRTPKYVTTGLGDKLYSWQVPFTETAGKVIPNVDYTNVAMQPLIQSLRVPAIAIGK